ncbi:MAG: SET domain-containing protein [Planctomycetes bacterium]|nr:SET domain-containing protein [Planctomycetota bacterium]
MPSPRSMTLPRPAPKSPKNSAKKGAKKSAPEQTEKSAAKPSKPATPARARARQDVVVRTTRIGRGVFALQAFEAEVLVSEIKGRVIHDPDYASDTCMDLGDGMILEAFAPFRFLNHSCEPNAELIVMDELDEDDRFQRRYMALYTLRAIEPGEEFTIDYAWCADAAIKCRCRTASCRGWVVAKEELAALVKKKRKKTPPLLR